MTDTRGYIAELLAKAVNRNALDSELTGDDKELILNLLRSYGDLDITQIWYPSYGYHRDNGTIVGAYIRDSDPGLRYGDMSPPERLKAAMAEGELIHPGYADEL